MDDRNVDQVVRSALAAGVVEAGPHPDPDTLFEYHAGELSAADADAVQGHLALCPACAQAVLDFEMFPHLDAASEEDDVPTAEEIEAGWADVQARLGRSAAAPVGVDRATGGAAEGASERGERAEADAQHAPPANVVPMTPRGGTAARPPAAPAHRVPAWLATAAALLAAAGGGYFWGTRGSTIVNVPNISLQPEDARARSETGPQFEIKKIPRGAELVRFAFPTRQEPDSGPFSIEVRDEDGRSVGRPIEGLMSDANEEVTFTLPGGRLPPGRYRFTLRAPDGRSVVAEYGLELQLSE